MLFILRNLKMVTIEIPLLRVIIVYRGTPFKNPDPASYPKGTSISKSRDGFCRAKPCNQAFSAENACRDKYTHHKTRQKRLAFDLGGARKLKGDEYNYNYHQLNQTVGSRQLNEN